MTGAELYVLALVLVAVGMFAAETFPVDVVGLLVLLALILPGVLPVDRALAGFANPALLTVGALFVVSEGVIRTGAVNFVGRWVSAAAGGRPTLMIALILVLVIISSAFVNNTPVVVLAVPLILGLSERYEELSPSRVLMSVSFASILGGTCTLIGTSTNILINSAAGPGKFAPLGMFEFLPLGLVFAAVGMVYLMLAGPYLLPDRKAAERVRPELLKEYLTEVRVGGSSPLVGKRLGDSRLAREDLRLLQLIRGDRIIWPPLDDVVLLAGDVLLIKGELSIVADLLRGGGVELPDDDSGAAPAEPGKRPRDTGKVDTAVIDSSQGFAAVGGRAGADEVHGREWTLAEVVLTPNSRLIGRTIERAAFRKHFGATVLAIRRQGEHIRQQITHLRLRVGDVLLVEGEPAVLDGLAEERDFLLLAGSGQTLADLPARAPIATAILIGVVGLAALQVYPMVVCALAGAAAMIVAGCLSTQKAYSAVSWHILMLVATMIALGQAMEDTGLARTLAVGARDLAAGVDSSWRPYVVLSVFYLLVTVLSNFVSNNAAALLFVPLALETAARLGVSERPFLFAVAYAASAAFALPIGYNTHLLVYGPGGYKLRDFVAFGGPLNLLTWILASLLIPVFWPF